jgi:ligand-binding sensor domain-containing protein/signal transduction histidine kinase
MLLPRLQLLTLCRLSVLLSLLAIATTVAHSEKLPIKSYTSADGIAGEYIQCIVPDSHGFIWFCSPEGLSRFDGYNFVNYGPEQGLPSRSVLHLLEQRDGSYWVGTTNGVCHFNLFSARDGSVTDKQRTNAGAFGILLSSPKFECYQLEGARRVNTMQEDLDGALWFGTNNGLFKLERSKDAWVFVPKEIGLPSTPENAAFISTMLVDRNGVLWIGAGTGLYRRMPDGRAERYTTVQGLPSDDVRALLEDRNNHLWIGTTHGLSEIVAQPNPHSLTVANVYTVSNGLPNDYVTALHQSQDERIWIGTDLGLTQFVPYARGASRFRTYATAQGFSGKEVRSLSEDRDGNLWIGTESDGAMKMARHGFVTYTEIDGLKDTRIASIFEDASGHLCVSSSHSGTFFVHRFDGTRLVANKPNLPAGVNRSWGWNQIAFQDHAREWWVDTAHGLYQFPSAKGVEDLANLRPATVYTKKDGLPGNEIFRLYEDRRGDIWISLADSPLPNVARWERASRKFYTYGELEALPSESAPTAFREDSAGNLWIGFYHGELVRYQGERFTRFVIGESSSIGLIRDLFVDHSGKLWIATTRNGLALVKDPNSEHPSVTTFTTNQGLASNFVNCITEDLQHRIYVGTPLGVDRLDPLTGRIKHYSKADGLTNNFVNVAYRDRLGALWFGTLQGLSRLIPEQDRQVPVPPILISQVRIAGVEESFSNLDGNDGPSLVLTPDRNQVQIDYVGLSFRAGETLRYQTMLEGADKTWGEPSLQRTVNYAQLAPGTYRFLVRAVTSDGTTSSRPATISFRILSPIWQRWWFLTLAGLFLAGVTFLAYRYRVAQLLELERVRTRIATDLHDDIGSSLSRMAILSEVLKRDKGVIPSSSVERLTDIADTSRSLVDTMSDIVWSIDPRRDDLRNVIQRLRQFASDVLETQGVKWKLTTAPELDGIKLTPEQRRHLFLIFKEALTNIARHSSSQNVSLSIKAIGNHLYAEICDDGNGFSSAETLDNENGNRGHGLANMRARAAELGGSLEIRSTFGSGTKIILHIPIRHGMNVLFSWRRN